jgi:tripartite-type tricarboxylate transporter receptor subunit TctC
MTTTRRAGLGPPRLAAPSLACAQAFPARPVRIVVPYPAGGGMDVLARAGRPAACKAAARAGDRPRRALALSARCAEAARGRLSRFPPAPWFGLFAPAATPPAILLGIRRALARVMAEADFDQRLVTGRGMTAHASTPEGFAGFILQDLQAKGRLIRVSGARGE